MNVLTDRGKTMLAAAVLLWLVSRLMAVRELSMAALAIAALLVLAVIYTRLTSANLHIVRRVHPIRLFHDAEGQVRVEIRNRGRLPTAILQVEDRAPSAIVDAARFILSPIRSGSGVAATYDLHGRHRGRYEIGPLVVRLRDPFGIAQRTELFTGSDEVIVYPPVWALPPGLPLGGRDGGGGEGRPRPLASGEELANIREYVRGDDLRKVHWRSTARRNKLMIRQDEAPQQPAATVVLDTRGSAHAGAGPHSSFEFAVATAASVTYHLSSRNYATRLVTGPIVSTPRARNWELGLEQLATLQPSAHTDLGPLWQQLSHGTIGDGVLFVIAPVPDASDLRMLVRAGRGFSQRLAVLLDAKSFGRNRHHRADPVTVAGLRAAGWRVTVVSAGERLTDRWPQLMLHQRGRSA